MKKEDVKRASELLKELEKLDRDIAKVVTSSRDFGCTIVVGGIGGDGEDLETEFPSSSIETWLRQVKALKEQALKELGVDLDESTPEESTTVHHDRAGRRPK